MAKMMHVLVQYILWEFIVMTAILHSENVVTGYVLLKKPSSTQGRNMWGTENSGMVDDVFFRSL
jgi:hypothetical protein